MFVERSHPCPHRQVADSSQFGSGRHLAAHAGVALAAARRHDSLNTALISRDVIGQAKGIPMERFRYTPDQAFSALVKASSDSNVKLRTVCEELCLTGILIASKGARSVG